MKKSVCDALYFLANTQKPYHAAGLSFYAPPSNDSLVALRLDNSVGLPLEGLTPFELLAAVFDQGACAWLRAMPNLYWFWELMAQTIVQHNQAGASDDNGLISERALRNAMDAIRSTVGDGHDLELAKTRMSEGDRMTRIAAGIITVERTGDVNEPKLRTTPMFTNGHITAYKQK